jgi:putative selenium metabolism hydrolase
MDDSPNQVGPRRDDLDRSALADFAGRLVGVSSPSGREEGVAELVRDELETLGLDVRVDRFGNVTGTLEAGPGACIVLDSHMDTVEVTDPGAWSYSPAGEIADGRLYGRGAMDMKGQLAASVYGVAALRTTLKTGRVVVSASVAEELVEGPSLVRVAEAARPDYVVICEATSRRVARAQRGRAEILVAVEGRQAHSSRPDLGLNAAEVMADVIAALRAVSLPADELLGDAILVLTDVISRPYPGLSVVPDRCLATYDRRTLPGEREDDVLSTIREAMAPVLARHTAQGTASIAVDSFTTYTGERMEAPNFAPAWCEARDAPVVATAISALREAGMPAEESHYAFCTNGSGSAGTLGIPTIGYGPGDEALAHRVDEHIGLDDMQRGAEGYAIIVTALAGLDQPQA